MPRSMPRILSAKSVADASAFRRSSSGSISAAWPARGWVRGRPALRAQRAKGAIIASGTRACSGCLFRATLAAMTDAQVAAVTSLLDTDTKGIEAAGGDQQKLSEARDATVAAIRKVLDDSQQARLRV